MPSRRFPLNPRTLTQLRGIACLTQEDLATRLGVDPDTISNWETGRTRPDFAMAARISEELKCDIADLGERSTASEGTQISDGRSNPEPVRRTAPSQGGVLSLPCKPGSLIGRFEAFRYVRSRLVAPPSAAPPAITVIRGWPGVGKTTFSAAVAYDEALRSYYRDGVLWASLGAHPNIGHVLTRWAHAVGLGTHFPSQDADLLSSIIRSAIHELSLLVIADDVWDAAHLRLLQVAGPRSTTLVTTRHLAVAQAAATRPDDIYRLDCLSPDDSMRLLQELAPDIVEKHPAECATLVHVIEGLPLALQVAGRLLRAEANRGWSVTNLLDELRDTVTFLEKHAPSDMADLQTQTTLTIVALLRKSSDVLTARVKERFAYLGAFAPKPAEFRLVDMQQIWEVDRAQAKQTVDDLVDRGLLEPLGEERFWMHALLVALARTICTQ